MRGLEAYGIVRGEKRRPEKKKEKLPT